VRPRWPGTGGVASVVAQRGGEVDGPGPAEHLDHQVAQAGDDVGVDTGTDLGGVLGEGDIPEVRALLHTIYRALPHHRTDRENAGALVPQRRQRAQRAAIAPAPTKALSRFILSSSKRFIVISNGSKNRGGARPLIRELLSLLAVLVDEFPLLASSLVRSAGRKTGADDAVGKSFLYLIALQFFEQVADLKAWPASVRVGRTGGEKLANVYLSHA
jgi:hypothetical protein